MIHDAEGTYNHERKAVLITVITRAEFNEFKQIMKQVDPSAFVSVSENVHILGFVVNLNKQSIAKTIFGFLRASTARRTT